MYYYIFDVKKCKKRSLVDDIKMHLSSLGISGEFCYPSQAYSTEELVKLGLSKKYNTIVGIGGDEIANSIAKVLCGKNEAMGFIPLEASTDLCDLIGANNWKEAADNLRYRKINEMKIGLTATGNAFLTHVELALKHPTEVTVEFKDYILQAKVNHLLISNFHKKIDKISPDFLDIVIKSSQIKQNGMINKLTSMFSSRKDEEDSLSLIRARSLRLFTSSQIPLTTNNVVIARTPQLFECSDDDLRLIVGKNR